MSDLSTRKVDEAVSESAAINFAEKDVVRIMSNLNNAMDTDAKTVGDTLEAGVSIHIHPERLVFKQNYLDGMKSLERLKGELEKQVAGKILCLDIAVEDGSHDSPELRPHFWFKAHFRKLA